MLCLVLGTGRCGSKSLTTLIDQQSGWIGRHEPTPHLPWEVDRGLLQSKIHFWAQFDEDFCEAGFYFLPYVKDILQQVGDVRFICLKREMQATVQSYLCKTNERPNEAPRNHWTDHEGKVWRLDPRWDKSFPNYKKQWPDRQHYIEKFYLNYYAKAQLLAGSHNEFLLLNMDEALNTRHGQDYIFAHLDITEPNYNVGITLNEGGNNG